MLCYFSIISKDIDDYNILIVIYSCSVLYFFVQNASVTDFVP